MGEAYTNLVRCEISGRDLSRKMTWGLMLKLVEGPGQESLGSCLSTPPAEVPRVVMVIGVSLIASLILPCH